MALQTAENATFAANRMAIVFSRLPIFPAISPTFSRTKYRHFWHGNQGDPDTANVQACRGGSWAQPAITDIPNPRSERCNA
jgi:hypothetical protein